MKPTRDRRLQLIGLFAKRDIDFQFQRPIAYRGVQILSEEASEELANRRKLLRPLAGSQQHLIGLKTSRAMQVNATALSSCYWPEIAFRWVAFVKPPRCLTAIEQTTNHLVMRRSGTIQICKTPSYKIAHAYRRNAGGPKPIKHKIAA